MCTSTCLYCGVSTSNPNGFCSTECYESYEADMASGDMWEDDDTAELSDVEADADTLASAGYGTDEDYGYFGGGEYDDFGSRDDF